MASSRNFFLRRVRLINIKDALTHFLFALSEDFTVSILANDINRDCTGQYHFRNKISKSDQKEKDEVDSRLAPKFHPATTRPRLGVVPSLRGETYRTWPITCVHFDQAQIRAQVGASFSSFGHPTQVDASLGSALFSGCTEMAFFATCV